jgi:CheY-like chemotaxis protein
MTARAGPILIVDDDVDIREVLAEALEDRGFEVVMAGNGLEAIERIRSLVPPPSIVLLDLMMPILDGYGFLHERKKDPLLASIPVAIITAGHGIDPNRLGNGAPIIPKPIDLPKLVEFLRDLKSEAERSA